MSQLLISVTSVEEARIALACGADFIDLKDPNQGALGALPLDAIKQITHFVHAQGEHAAHMISATIGDLPMQASLILENVIQLARTQVDIIKIGFFEASNYQACLSALQPIAESGQKLIAVLFAEYQYPADLIEAIKNAGFYGVMLDTAVKNGATLFDYYSQEELKRLVDEIVAKDLIFGLAGSLNVQHVALVKCFNPDFIGFRGGVSTDNQRHLTLDAEKIKVIRKVL